jgi:monofunctional biosynthetic peptidoglycan transglycosylase
MGEAGRRGHGMAQSGAESRRQAPTIRVGPAVRRRRRPLRRLLRGLFALLLLLAAIPLALAPLYAVVDPPVTPLMLLKRLEGAPIAKEWAPLEDVSPHLVRAVLVAEDARFCEHHGIDWRQVAEAVREAREGESPRGASTITMQTVKNLFLWPGRSWLRKALEAPLALYADLVWTKKRTLEIYLNVVEWDTGVYGAAAAAEHHFGVAAGRVTASQAARLAATLPAPEARDPTRPGPRAARLARTIAARAKKAGPLAACVLE